MNYLIWHLLKPSHALLYLLVIGCLFGRRRWGRVLVVGAIAAFVACAVLPVATVITRPLEERFPRPLLTEVDGIVVLAGAELAVPTAYRDEPQLSGHADRLTSFLILANRFPQARLVHSGGSSEPLVDQSAVARRVILGAGIAPERVIFDGRSSNTCESPHNVRAHMQPERGETWLLVTSAAHMPRAMACFRAAAWDVTPYPTDYQTGSSMWWFGLADNLQLLDFAAHEWLGLGYYRLTGRTSEFFPQP